MGVRVGEKMRIEAPGAVVRKSIDPPLSSPYALNVGSKLDFGRYLQSVMERDIDLLLMEEFHAEPTFVTMFCGAIGLPNNIEFDGAWHSLNDAQGETDLLLRVQNGAERIGILIENKVVAVAQPEQDHRYHLRALRSQEAGRFDRYVTAICAPDSYLSGVPADSAYQHLVSYEQIRDWFLAQSGGRAEWRAAVMQEAIDQGRRGYTMIVHSGRSTFHLGYWEFLKRNYPQFYMRKPSPKGPKSSWMRFRGHNFPKGVTLNHKADRSAMDLEFAERSVEDVLSRRTSDWPCDIIVKQTGKSTVLRLAVPPCDLDASPTSQESQLTGALDAAVQLAPFADLFR